MGHRPGESQSVPEFAPTVRETVRKVGALPARRVLFARTIGRSVPQALRLDPKVPTSGQSALLSLEWWSNPPARVERLRSPPVLIDVQGVCTSSASPQGSDEQEQKGGWHEEPEPYQRGVGVAEESRENKGTEKQGDEAVDPYLSSCQLHGRGRWS